MGRRRPPACRCTGFRTLHVGESMSLTLSCTCMACPDTFLAHLVPSKVCLQHSEDFA